MFDSAEPAEWYNQIPPGNPLPNYFADSHIPIFPSKADLMKKLLLLVLPLFFLQSCEQQAGDKPSKTPESVSEAQWQELNLNKAIVGTPGDIVSVESPIDLTFNKEVIPPHMSGKVLDKSPFQFDPPVQGSAKWLNQVTVRYTPSDRLEPGTNYSVLFKGKVAFGTGKSVNDFSFSFKTAEQEVVGFTGDFVPAETGKNMVRFTGTVSFAQPVIIANIQKHLRCVSEKEKISVAVSASKQNSRVVNILLPPMKRETTGRTLSFLLPGQYTVDRKEWKRDVLLPAANRFKVLAHMELSDSRSDQTVYGFRFSDPVQKGMDLSGFVSIEPDMDFAVSVDGKYLRIQSDFEYGRKYTVTLTKGLPSALGTELPDNYTATFSFSNVKPVIEWLSEGIYLPSDNKYKLQFKSINVQNVSVTVTRIYENNMGFFVQKNVLHDADARQSNNNPYYSPYGGGRSPHTYTDLDRVGKQIYSRDVRLTTRKNKWIKTELDLSKAFAGKKNAAFVVTLKFGQSDLCGRCINDRNDYREGDLFYNENDYYKSPCRSGYYYRNGTLSKLLVASDIALTLKKARDGIHVFAVNALTAEPVSGFELAEYSYLNQVLHRKTTDSRGHALFPTGDNWNDDWERGWDEEGSADSRLPGEGWYIRGETGNGLAMIRLDHPSWALSSYDISGVDDGQSGMDVFMYADRGVHRPGDTVHLSALVRSDRTVPPSDQPVSLKVTNPLNQTVIETRQRCGPNGHVYFAVPTDIQDPTGDYTARLSVAGKSFTKQLKIETVKPNRLKINIDVPDTVLSAEGRVRGELASRYLFGTPAGGLRAVLKARYSEKPLSIPTFDDFTFGHPLRTYRTRNKEIFDRTLDEEGKTAISFAVEDITNTPELLRVSLESTVYEKGGGFTKQTRSLTVTPYRGFVGMKNVFRGRARTGESYKLPIILTNIQGEPIVGRKLRIRWYVSRRHYWWHYDNRDRKDFRKESTSYKIAEYTVFSEDKPVVKELEVDDYGQHMIEVIDEQGGHRAGLFFFASSWGQEAPEAEQDIPLLEIASDKNIYYTGDNATLSCETPKDGMAIFTVEQGYRIIHQEVKRVSPGRTEFTFPITNKHVPNCYASISLIQPSNRSDNDLPLRIYGIKPLQVEDPSARLGISMSAPEELKPNERFDVRISSRDDREATYTVAVVDEGLLDLTGFETPDAWEHYFQKRRLGVITRDNFDEILGRILPEMDNRVSIGGGIESERKKRAGESRVQRFKPVVMFAGPVTVKPGKTATTSFVMPNYVGSVRIMVVAAAENSYASLDKTVPVKQPLMILPTVPRVARPGDIFQAPVSVFAMSERVKSASVKISVSDNLVIEGENTKSVAFERPGEKDVSFRVRVKDRIGKGTIIVQARSDVFSMADTTSLPLSSPNPYYIKATDTTVTNAASVTLIPKPVGIEGTNSARVAVARFPDIQLSKRLKDLIRYPYGCIEQTTSSAFPQLFIHKVVDLEGYQKQRMTDNVNSAIKRLRRFKLQSGFSYWPRTRYSRSSYSGWGTSYAGHFLIEARKAGYHVPDGLYDHWVRYAKSHAKTVNEKNHRYQTYRLFLLALADEPHVGAMNLVRENYLNALDPLSKKLLAASYYLAGKESAASQIDSHVRTEITSYRETGGTYGSSLRDRCMLAYLEDIMGNTRAAVRLMRSIARDFHPDGWYSTQETAFALLAIGAIFADSDVLGGIRKAVIERPGRPDSTLDIVGYQVSVDLTDFFGKEVSIRTDKSEPLFVTLFEEGIPLGDIVETENEGLELTRNFYDDAGLPITLDQIRQGNMFWVRYRVQSTTGESLNELALSSLFPAGWEIINPRMEDIKPPEWVREISPSQGKYMDVRDDRVNWFFDLSGRGKINFLIRCNPSFAGIYRLPPISVEAMYSPEYYARIASDTVTVE